MHFVVTELSATKLNLLSGHCRDYLRAATLTEPGYGLRMARVNLVLNRALLEMVKRTAKLPPAALTLVRALSGRWHVQYTANFLAASLLEIQGHDVMLLTV